MIGTLLEGVIYLIFHILIEVLLIGSGEIILFCMTLGKRKPVWTREYQGSAAKVGILIDLSFIVGFLFWLSLAWLLFSIIFP
jgi:hypothetical protein